VSAMHRAGFLRSQIRKIRFLEVAAVATPGPKPKSTALRALEGDKNKDRYNLREPKAGPLDFTDIPATVAANPDALEMWNHLGPRLVKMGTLQEVDRFSFEMACVTFGLWRMRHEHQLMSKVNTALGEFGVGGAYRARLVSELKEDTPDDPVAAKLRAL
jgi:hypothetical protein